MLPTIPYPTLLNQHYPGKCYLPYPTLPYPGKCYLPYLTLPWQMLPTLPYTTLPTLPWQMLPTLPYPTQATNRMAKEGMSMCFEKSKLLFWSFLLFIMRVPDQ